LIRQRQNSVIGRTSKSAIEIELQLFSLRVIAEFEDQTINLTTAAKG